MDELDLLTLPEVAAICRMPEATLRWRRSRGMEPRSMKLGKRVVYKRSDVMRWVAAVYEADQISQYPLCA
jgi:predicted DNA-binding transcriptional regulator AlpA